MVFLVFAMAEYTQVDASPGAVLRPTHMGFVETKRLSPPGRSAASADGMGVKNLVYRNRFTKGDNQNADRARSCVYMTTETTVNRRYDHREGILAKAIEEQTAKLPSDTFLWAAGGSIAASLTLKLIGRDKDAVFVGQWAPTFLILGLYNKLVKQLGSDRTEN